MPLYPMELFYEAIQKEQYFPVGTFKKPNGINGGITALFLYKIDEAELVKLPALFVEIDNIKVPYSIKNITLTEHKTIIQLDLIQSKNQAYALRNLPLLLPISLRSTLIKSVTPYSFLVDFLVNDLILGKIGKIETIYCIRDQYIVGVRYQDKELLIPYGKPFVISMDKKARAVTIQLPEGYLAAML
ncbi:hypothetical protein EDM02_05210 [Candidatus Cardinium hertigii]|uniref:Ribosome maturation factor RimM PRC barrel domain-containing protein n=2 Tax=Candidatus Cardinium hertigii TaxID=247481 RepID=A0A3N2QAW7_9BACT|nr:hypothetical protein EDM02_05210 [Candidatus Cardinium hertigii]